MVDEQYHSLMHITAKRVDAAASASTNSPTVSCPNRTRREHISGYAPQWTERWQRSLTTLAFATVSEISINAYLDLLAD